MSLYLEYPVDLLDLSSQYILYNQSHRCSSPFLVILLHLYIQYNPLDQSDLWGLGDLLDQKYPLDRYFLSHQYLSLFLRDLSFLSIQLDR